MQQATQRLLCQAELLRTRPSLKRSACCRRFFDELPAAFCSDAAKFGIRRLLGSFSSSVRLLVFRSQTDGKSAHLIATNSVNVPKASVKTLRCATFAVAAVVGNKIHEIILCESSTISIADISRNEALLSSQ